MLRRWLAPCAVLLATACGSPTGPGGDSPGDEATNVPGRTDRTVNIQGLNREFVVYVGSSVGANTPVPVVFMLHGTSGDGPQYYNVSAWREKADAAGLIAVFPSALTHCLHEDENKDGDFTDVGERHVVTKWAHGELGDPSVMPLCTPQEIETLNAQNRALADHPLADDMAFFDAMVAFVKENHRVDAKAIYVTGFSNGAQMSSRLAFERSSVFAATAAHAGGVGVDPTPGRNLSAVASVGTLDDRLTVPLGVSEIPIGESTLQAYPLLAGVFIVPMLEQLPPDPGLRL